MASFYYPLQALFHVERDDALCAVILQVIAMMLLATFLYNMLYMFDYCNIDQFFKKDPQLSLQASNWLSETLGALSHSETHSDHLTACLGFSSSLWPHIAVAHPVDMQTAQP
jgi:hypothetical protein